MAAAAIGTSRATRIAAMTARGQNLDRTEPEHEAPQGAQALPGQLHADHEHQEDHAEFGQVRDLGPVADGEGRDPVMASAKRPRPKGPSRAPAPMKPSTG